jgi:hypothetical protein
MAGGNGHSELGFEYWSAFLAAAIGGALVTEPFELSKRALRDALQRFTRSQQCSTELREIIRNMRKGE